MIEWYATPGAELWSVADQPLVIKVCRNDETIMNFTVMPGFCLDRLIAMGYRYNEMRSVQVLESEEQCREGLDD